jgi:hypothetical protein
MRIPSGVSDQYIYFVGLDAEAPTQRKTGLSGFTVYRSRNGGASAAFTTPTVNETDVTNMPGCYELLLDEDMTIDAGDDSQEMLFHITATGMVPVSRVIELYRPTPVGLADGVWDEAVDGATTARESLRLANSANGGKLSGATTGTPTTVEIRDLADSKDRVTADVDEHGNRSTVTLDLS